MIKTAINAFRWFWRHPRQFRFGKTPRDCPICGYHGLFYAVGVPPRYDARCPSCRSRERHRLVHLFFERHGIAPAEVGAFLHIAPEPHFAKWMRGNAQYHSVDLAPGRARHCADIQALPFANDCFDWAMANHVLEHVADDSRALAELYRVLKPGGRALLTVPQNWAREKTYQNPDIKTPAAAFAHYADPLHVRFYGRDFADLVRKAGFTVDIWRLAQDEEVRFGLLRDEALYLCTKPCVQSV